MEARSDALYHVSRPAIPPSTRVPVSDSIMYAYSAMRGNIGKNMANYGPLHDALFLHPYPPQVGAIEQQIHLPNWRFQSRDEGPQILFWDPTCPVWEEQELPETLKEYNDIKNPEKHPSTLEGHSREELLRRRPSHYRGEECFANYGYVSINGKWVDPDSQGDVLDTLKNSDGVPESTRNGPIKITPPSLLPLDQSYALYNELCTGTRKLSDGEVDTMGDFQDGEPDPRLLRISPATFARWAVGSSQGDAYVRSNAECKKGPPSCRRPGSGITPLKIQRQVQFDVETGSLLSGIYEPERDPSIVYSAQGVDPIKRPQNFARSYPMGDLAIDRAAYTADERMQRTQEWVSSTVASAPKVYNSEGARDEFANPNDPESGENIYYENAARLSHLTQAHHNGLSLNAEKYTQANAAEDKSIQLQREIFFMKRRVEGDDEQTIVPSTPRAQARPAPLIQIPRRRSGRGQFQRYFDEREEKEMLAIQRTRMTNERLDRDLEAIHDGMGELLKIHKHFLDALNVGSVAELGKLCPEAPMS